MDNTEVVFEPAGDTANIKVKGFISESCKLFEHDISGFKNVNIDFEETTFINSLGIRLWMEWYKSDKVSEGVTIHLLNCVPSIVSQFNMIKGFVAENCIVESIYANYFVEDTSQEKKILLKRGEDFMPEEGGEKGWVKLAESFNDDEGNELTLDTIKEKYFAFLGTIDFQAP